MFQNYALFPHLNCLENVAFSLKMAGNKKAERNERAMAMLSLVEMQELKNRLPSQLSGGQQQRVALARALVGTQMCFFWTSRFRLLIHFYESK